MTALDNAKAALDRYIGRMRAGTEPNQHADDTADALADLIAYTERLTAEMHQRELHHFETEQLLTEAGIDPDDIEAARVKVEHLTATPTDADRQALDDVITRAFVAHANGAGSPLLAHYISGQIIAATGRRFLPGTITEGMVEAAARALVGDAMTDKQWAHYMGEHHMAGYFMGARRALEAAARAQQEER